MDLLLSRITESLKRIYLVHRCKTVYCSKKIDWRQRYPAADDKRNDRSLTVLNWSLKFAVCGAAVGYINEKWFSRSLFGCLVAVLKRRILLTHEHNRLASALVGSGRPKKTLVSSLALLFEVCCWFAADDRRRGRSLVLHYSLTFDETCLTVSYICER